MADKTWKAFERRVAVLLGTRRIPVTGERNGADAETPMFCFQFKKRARQFPRYVAEWLALVCEKAATRAPAKIGVVILQQPRGADLDALVVVSLRDWIDLHGPSGAAPAPEVPPRLMPHQVFEVAVGAAPLAPAEAPDASKEAWIVRAKIGQWRRLAASIRNDINPHEASAPRLDTKARQLEACADDLEAALRIRGAGEPESKGNLKGDKCLRFTFHCES